MRELTKAELDAVSGGFFGKKKSKPKKYVATNCGVMTKTKAALSLRCKPLK